MFVEVESNNLFSFLLQTVIRASLSNPPVSRFVGVRDFNMTGKKMD